MQEPQPEPVPHAACARAVPSHPQTAAWPRAVFSEVLMQLVQPHDLINWSTSVGPPVSQADSPHRSVNWEWLLGSQSIGRASDSMGECSSQLGEVQA